MKMQHGRREWPGKASAAISTTTGRGRELLPSSCYCLFWIRQAQPVVGSPERPRSVCSLRVLSAAAGVLPLLRSLHRSLLPFSLGAGVASFPRSKSASVLFFLASPSVSAGPVNLEMHFALL